MSFETIEKVCVFCKNNIKVRRYHDPLHLIFDCPKCCKYVLLNEQYKTKHLFEINDFSVYKEKIKSIVLKFKEMNPNIYFDDVRVVIGNVDDIETFKNSVIVKEQHQGVNWQYVSYADLLINDDVVEF